MIGACYRGGWVLSGTCGPWGVFMHTVTGETCVVKLADVGPPCPCGAEVRFQKTGRLR